MASQKITKSIDQKCPAVDKDVEINYVIVSLPSGPSDIGKKDCSNIAKCLEQFGNLSTEPNCSLHTLTL